MRISRRSLVRGVMFGGAAAALPGHALATRLRASDPPADQVTADEALTLLKAGNRAFVAGKPAHFPFDEKRRKILAEGQHPFATIVCCSDSRVGPEQIFESGLGQLFVIRNAGSTVANAQAMGSIEYSVEHLGVPLIVVLGHSKCGAVAAATQVVETHAHLEGSLAGMVEPILPAVQVAKGLKPADLVQSSVLENVRLVAHQLRAPSQPVLAKAMRAGKLKVVGAEYYLDTGVVDFFDLG